ncbi:Uncharacterised protein [Yersinia aldovae]|uniref:hypothetical protein n=1 Tax=Yersinia aldovae TaxID=29483 RepID=UPI0005DFC2CE|nr:hypothetical protein [Yersinia aldovae]CNJ33800.1 Uncharacterised protein [Yersinia aldovae]
MEMNIYKWLIVILVGGIVGGLGVYFLTTDMQPAEPTFAQRVDQYGAQIESHSANSVRYVGYKNKPLYEDLDSVQLTFTAINDKFERSHDLSDNKEKAANWETLFCTDELQDIAEQYDAESTNLLGRVRVVVVGIVLTNKGQQGINAVCN